MQLLTYLQALAIIASSLKCVAALPPAKGVQAGPLVRGDAAEAADIRLVRIGPNGEILETNSTKSNNVLQKRSEFSAWLFSARCSGNPDYTWTNAEHNVCYSFVDSNGNQRDMYSVDAPDCTPQLYHDDYNCNQLFPAGGESTGCNWYTNDNSIKSFMCSDGGV